MGKVDKFYPVQGSNKFETVSFPITKAFHIDMGGNTSKTNKLYAVPKGSLILGFAARITEAFVTGADTNTFQLGFVGTQMLSSKQSSSKTSVGVYIGPSTTAVKVPVLLSTQVTTSYLFQTVVSDCYTAGQVDVFLTYIPHPQDSLSTSDFLSYTAT